MKEADLFKPMIPKVIMGLGGVGKTLQTPDFENVHLIDDVFIEDEEARKLFLSKEDAEATYLNKTEAQSKLDEVNNAIDTKQDALKAGAGIAIADDQTISVTLDTTLFRLVTELPTEGIEDNKIYLVPDTVPGEKDVYVEYIYTNGEWEQLGEFKEEIDLEPYLLKADADNLYFTKDKANNRFLQKTDAEKNYYSKSLGEANATNIATLTGYFDELGKAKESLNSAKLENLTKAQIIDEARTGYETAVEASEKYAEKGHAHALDSADLTGILPVEKGGTGSSDLSMITVGTATKANDSERVFNKTESELFDGYGKTSVLDEKYMPLAQEFKTINGEAIKGTGDIVTIDYTDKTPETTISQGGVYPDAFGKEGIFPHGETFNIQDENKNIAIGRLSHAEGNSTKALGDNSHAEGNSVIVKGMNCHGEGAYVEIHDRAQNAHAEGNSTYAYGSHSHAEGMETLAIGSSSHAEGSSGELCNGQSSTTLKKLKDALYDIETNYNNNEDYYLALWNNNKFNGALGDHSHVEGADNLALGLGSHAEGYQNVAYFPYSHAEGAFSAVVKNAIHTVGVGGPKGRENAHVITLDYENEAKNGLHYIKGIGGFTGKEIEFSSVKDLATVIKDLNDHDEDLIIDGGTF